MEERNIGTCAEDDEQPSKSSRRPTYLREIAGGNSCFRNGWVSSTKPQPVIKAIKLADLQIIAQPNTSVACGGEEDVLLVRDAQNKVRAFNPTCTHKVQSSLQPDEGATRL